MGGFLPLTNDPPGIEAKVEQRARLGREDCPGDTASDDSNGFRVDRIGGTVNNNKEFSRLSNGRPITKQVGIWNVPGSW